MFVRFSDKISPSIHDPFVSYAFNEELSKSPSFVDIRAIVQTNTTQWLNDLSHGHLKLGNRISQHCAWWWWLPQARLDARPWGQESIIKPLFFARAVVDWLRSSPSGSLNVIGAPKIVQKFICEFEPKVVVQGVPLKGDSRLTPIIQYLADLVWKSLVLLRFLFDRNTKVFKSSTMILFERFGLHQNLGQARDYFFSKLFEDIPHECACLDPISPRRKSFQGAMDILSEMHIQDLPRALGRNIYLGILVLWFGFFTPPCIIANAQSKSFWRHFLWGQFSRSVVLRESLVYDVFSRWATQGTLRTVVYPYEEKGYERALLLALKSSRVKTIGYTPHPQHELAVSMQDGGTCRPPRPTMYGVCGPAYVGYFQHWGRKKNTIHVWGSAKSCQQDFRDIQNVHRLNTLILLSHPHELEVFYSWLKAEPGLTENIHYLIRGYQSVPSGLFARRLATLGNDYPQAKAVSGELGANLSEADLAIFNATSAGLLAVNAGKLVVHACLDDFFKINCCFNNLGPMLSCATAKELAQRLQEIRRASRDQRQYLWRQQVKATAEIFGRINHQEIQNDIS